MSAWIVTPYHIDILVTWAASQDVAYVFNNARHTIQGDEPRVAKVLMDENVRSVNHRYNEKNKVRYKFNSAEAALTLLPGAILKNAGCLDYQSCECGDYDATEAKAINRAIETRAVGLALSVPERVALRMMNEEFDSSKLPGYEEAPWGFTKPKKTRTKLQSQPA